MSIVVAPRFGRYEVVSHLASGGMAEVYLTRAVGDGGFARHLVVKAMRPSPGLDGTFARMFLDEARLAATLHHQHIAQVFDLGTTGDGSYYLAMEYVHGETVRNVVAQARARSLPLPPGFGIAIGAAVASALQYAHERTDERGLPLRIVHRDVTPANILCGHDGAVKLIDFGIAKAAARTSTTQTGVVKGKAGYMAPEQVLNEPIDARTDVFALGIVLYELTTQERLFAGQTDFESAQRCVGAEVPRPSTVKPGFPSALEAVLMTALARDPDARFPSAGAMGHALVDAAARDGLDAHPTVVERVIGALFGVRPEPWQRVAPRRADTDVDDDEDEDGTTERLPGMLGVEELADAPSAAVVGAHVSTTMPAAESVVAMSAASASASPERPLANMATGPSKRTTLQGHAVSERLPSPSRTARLPSFPPAAKPPIPPASMSPVKRSTLPPLPPGAAPRSTPAGMPPLPPPEPQAVPVPVLSEASQRAAAEPTLVAPMMPVLSLPLRPPEEPPKRDADAHWMDDSEPEPFELPPRLGSVPHRPITEPLVLPRRRRKIAGYVAAAMLLGAAAGIAASIAAGGDRPIAPEPPPPSLASLAPPVSSEPPPPPALAAPPPVSTPAPQPAPAPPAAAIVPGKQRVRIHITTTPPDATVLVDNKRMGRTPFEAVIEPRGDHVWLKVRKRGHATRKVKVPVEPTLTWDVHLPRR